MSDSNAMYRSTPRKVRSCLIDMGRASVTMRVRRSDPTSTEPSRLNAKSLHAVALSPQFSTCFVVHSGSNQSHTVPSSPAVASEMREAKSKECASPFG